MMRRLLLPRLPRITKCSFRTFSSSSPFTPVKIIDGSSKNTVLFTCEHASNFIPRPWGWKKEDLWLKDMHWGYDIGSEALTNDLVKKIQEKHNVHTTAVLSCWSRILLDPNRETSSPTMFRITSDDIPILLNKDLSEEEKTLRRRTLYEPYHTALSEQMKQKKPQLLVSVHSFTDNYMGQKRPMEIGVLFNRDTGPAQKIHEYLLNEGYASALNEPWSGKEGLMYSVDFHTKDREDCLGVMLEVRQDLIVDEQWRSKLVHHLVNILNQMTSFTSFKA